MLPFLNFVKNRFFRAEHLNLADNEHMAYKFSYYKTHLFASRMKSKFTLN